MQELPAGEWTVEQWSKAWSIQVGRVYVCRQCNTMIMVTKGGVGNLEPICCGQGYATGKPQSRLARFVHEGCPYWGTALPLSGMRGRGFGNQGWSGKTDSPLLQSTDATAIQL